MTHEVEIRTVNLLERCLQHFESSASSWTQGCFARNAAGAKVSYAANDPENDSKQATMFCPIGMLMKEGGHEPAVNVAIDVIRRTIVTMGYVTSFEEMKKKWYTTDCTRTIGAVIDWNDKLDAANGTSIVCRMLRGAIAILKQDIANR